MVVGGTLYYNGIISSNFDGLRDAFIFDRNTRQWIIVQPMGAGRWYPTQVTLGDGRVLAVSGFTEGANSTPCQKFILRRTIAGQLFNRLVHSLFTHTFSTARW
jgi:hypothetical protein